ncbi:restriction endonuclease subunit S [Acinetobacter indicus]|uniref:restriction endonuclease subunit S n=1 Tax=Acinetobacter indicus TaxID=756892 RepID=UPI000CEC844A|nr:restriction endonuclease subunit S [Acinetobacter indicus]
MEFKQYPSYKKSGVEWLGDVPEHWGVNRLGGHFKNRKEKVSDKDFKPLSVTKHGIVPQLEHAAKSDNGDNRKLVRKGDYVINSRSDRKGSSGLADLDGSVSLINIVLTPFKTIHPKFSHYLLRSYLFQEEFYKYGHGIVADLWTTNYEDMRNIHLALPSVSEQTQISNFLEQETTRIDTLIAKQEKLIELLEEQRKSIISHAVTKGLNPNAPMKDSGVEWLGEVPEHWKVISIKFLAHCSSGQGINSLEVLDIADDKNSFPVIGGNGMMGWTSKSNYKEPVLSIGRVGALCGNVHLINYPSWISDNSLILKVYSKKVNLEILQYILLSRNLNNLASKSAQPLITGTQVKNEKITLPPPNEQSQILQYIIQNQSRINNLISKQKSLIEKLKEYRASIISHAVTGKIDVREFGA